MRTIPILVCLLSTLSLLPLTARAQTAAGAPPTPTDFDSKAPLPKNITLPAKLDIPFNTHIEITVKTKIPLPPIPPSQMNNPCLLMNPVLESAVIESNQQDVHATFHWQGGRSSEAFIIQGICFRLNSLGTPQNVLMMGSALDLWLNLQVITNGADEGSGGNFPGTAWYSPSTFAGTASLNGSTVLVFTPGGKKPTETKTAPATDTYPKGPSICLDTKTLLPIWIDNNTFILTCTFTPDSNVQINPQGPYLKAIQKQFGHWP